MLKIPYPMVEKKSWMMEDLRYHQFMKVIEWKTLMGVELSPLDCTAPENIICFIRCNCNVSKKKKLALPPFVAEGDTGFHVFPLVVIAMELSARIVTMREVLSDEDSVRSDEEANRNIFDICEV
ncbi:unnamed protein product [Lepeophtheirus salmonis]|uniref:(salmon louse) hypothetical protein n=1 Tax=Lepeophtheirus salmonis TaxID=72036 RepID=A0A7R8CSP6_LEPSM|nr:unnamed protein product [Lepeophtheirus salmonis]CAF2918883.1 unnamed protein product [Lepeophtheirus salmonis]